MKRISYVGRPTVAAFTGSPRWGSPTFVNGLRTRETDTDTFLYVILKGEEDAARIKKDATQQMAS